MYRLSQYHMTIYINYYSQHLQNKAILNQTYNKSQDCVQEAARGCILGAFVGDAIGAVLEFYHGKITQKQVSWATTFPGGGCFEVAPGQFTDDSEMALSLMNGLINAQANKNYQKSIAIQYYEWYKSPPFDIGDTTK